ncbi:MAG: CBS domain-containing protein [Acidobacteriota bacterium]|nr:CBS domain-containing protein [Acidobacteriota bacterium]
METNVYWLWLLSMGSLIFLMQAGFFLLEGGQVRSRDVANVMMKMTGHMGVGIIVFLLFGFAIKQYGWPLAALPNGWHAPWQFISDGGHSIAFYVSLMFALVSCAIPSGCFSGRMKFSAYLLFAALYVGVIYPVFAYILWNGPLARLGVQDYAGSLGVHAVGGIVGLVGAKFLGRRKTPATAHDVPMMGLGAMMLMFCWFGFNLGSVPSYGNMAADLPLVAINTLAAMAGGIMGSMAGTWAQNGKADPIITPNGGLAGAVAICSGVHLVHPIYAILLGVVAGAQIPWTARFIAKKLDIDDPCGVGPVHMTPGLLGGLAAGLWAPMIPNGFHGYTVHFLPQLIGTVTAIAYGLVASVALFWLLQKLFGLRVSADEELSGLDVAEHGMAAYPEFFPEAGPRTTPLHVLSAVRVDQVMTAPATVRVGDTLETVQELMFSREVFAVPVLNPYDELCGIITMADVTKIAREERSRVAVAAVYTREVESAFPDQTIHEIVERMRERHLANFPVVSRREEHRLLGMVSKTDIVLAYRRIAIGDATSGD